MNIKIQQVTLKVKFVRPKIVFLVYLIIFQTIQGYSQVTDEDSLFNNSPRELVYMLSSIQTEILSENKGSLSGVIDESNFTDEEIIVIADKLHSLQTKTPISIDASVLLKQRNILDSSSPFKTLYGTFDCNWRLFLHFIETVDPQEYNLPDIPVDSLSNWKGLIKKGIPPEYIMAYNVDKLAKNLVGIIYNMDRLSKEQILTIRTKSQINAESRMVNGGIRPTSIQFTYGDLNINVSTTTNSSGDWIGNNLIQEDEEGRFGRPTEKIAIKFAKGFMLYNIQRRDNVAVLYKTAELEGDKLELNRLNDKIDSAVKIEDLLNY